MPYNRRFEEERWQRWFEEEAAKETKEEEKEEEREKRDGSRKIKWEREKGKNKIINDKWTVVR